MTRHRTLAAAMRAGDELAEVEMRYEMLAEAFTDSPQLRANLTPALERAKAEIIRLRALASQTSAGTERKLVPIDPARFRRSGA